MGIISFFKGGSQKEKLSEALNNGAVIIDVRTPSEFAQGHPEGAKNFPLATFEQNIDKIKKIKKPVVLCCASGARSGVAKNILQKHGVECYKAGSWYSLN